jgi:hypothetical protein
MRRTMPTRRCAGTSPEDEQVKLTLLIAQVNAWNRIKIGFRAVHPAEEKKAAA